MRPPVRIAIPLLAVSLAVSACAGVEHGPHTAANDKAMASIEAAGGDPADWFVDNGCAAAGPCDVELSLAADRDAVVATNSYRVKDSFPTAQGIDAIRRTVERAERRHCLDRFGAGAALVRCVGGS